MDQVNYYFCWYLALLLSKVLLPYKVLRKMSRFPTHALKNVIHERIQRRLMNVVLYSLCNISKESGIVPRWVLHRLNLICTVYAMVSMYQWLRMSAGHSVGQGVLIA